jgi:photosystem II stability/assembly factor-like uncharacterized protein
MLDDQNGWAVTQDKHVLHTTSGAEKWREATPSTGGVQYTLGVYDFLDAQSAWVAMRTSDKFSIFRTYNGGGLWLETPLLDAGTGVTQISFADPQNGWLLFDKEDKGQTQAVDVFHTNDGGGTWLQVSSVSSSTDDQANGLPFNGRKTGISFRSGSTGWITGSVVDSKNPFLYTTGDGGFSWKLQTLPLPSDASGTIMTLPPQFSNANDGILPVTFTSGGSNKVEIYTTQDGGKTWKGGNPTADISSTIAFGGDHQALAIGANGNAGNVYSTSDDGRSWQQLPKPDASVTKLIALNFVSSKQSWVLAATSSDAVRLFQTTDNGKSWTRLNTTAST